MPEFVKGPELRRLFFEEAFRPIHAAEFPSLRYAAALLGTGSELHGFADRLLARIGDERVRRIAARRPIGGLNLFSDSTDLVSHAVWCATLRKLYSGVHTGATVIAVRTTRGSG